MADSRQDRSASMSDQVASNSTDAPSLDPRPWPEELERMAISDASQEDEPTLARPQAEAISVASVWQMASPDAADLALAGKANDFIYRRDGHPNERTLANALAKLHGGAKAVVTAQGMSSLAAVALSRLQPGSCVWIGDELYGTSTKLFRQDLTRWQVDTRVFDSTSEDDLDQLSQSAVDLVLVETLSNPRLRVTDIKRVAEATHQAGGYLMVDNTFATHLLCRPLDIGADMVVESLSKQVNGHSDSMLGLLTARDAQLVDDASGMISSFGLASSPLDCFLTHRGLSTLALRMERTCQNAKALAESLSGRAGILGVDYPGLANHPHHELALRQLRGGFGWMLSLHLPLNRDQVSELFKRLSPDIPFVPSLGDIQTTVSHPASTSHRGLDAKNRQQLGIHEGTIRVSCGIEPTDWLVERFLSSVQHFV